jgi:hypothetical protein
MKTRRGRLVVAATLPILLLPLVAAPAGAITNGRAKNSTDHQDQLRKGGFVTAQININNGERACSGVVLNGDVLRTPTYHSNNWVLTASSCFADDPATDYHVPAGPPKKPATVRADSDDDDGGVEYSITNLVPRQDRDLVLAAVDNANSLASAHVAFGAPRVGETLTTAGYGRTATDWAPVGAQIGQVKVNSVTATAVNVGGSSVCKGDAGGPLYREVGDRFEIVGVHGVSWQQGCFASTETRNGATDARVDDLYDWFRQQIPNFNFSCAHTWVGYGNDAAYYSIKAGGGLYVVGQHREGALEGVSPSPTTFQMWYVLRTLAATATWAGEIRIGPTQPGLTDEDPWTHPIWEVHRKEGAQDTFNDGDLRLWTDPTWYWELENHPMSPLKGGDRVATGWQRYLDPAYRNLFTVDSEGRIYAVDASGALREFNWQPGTKTWRNPVGDVVDTGWGKFDSITASGDGVLYARTPAGNMFRFQYDHTTSTWSQRDKAAGSGWNAYTGITSPGGDVLYGSGSKKAGKPVLRWHRYLSELDVWAPRDQDGLGVVVSEDTALGSDTRLQATPNMCSLGR